MALSLPHLRTAIKAHHQTITHRELRSINKSNKENYIDDLFGFPPSRPVAGEARKRFSDIDSDNDDDETSGNAPVIVFKTPFQPHRAPSATTDSFRGSEAVSTGSGFGQPEDQDRLQQKNYDQLPSEIRQMLNQPQDDDAHVPIPPTSPHIPE